MYHKKCWKVHGIFLLLLSMLLLNACHMPAGSEQTEENIMDERENSEESNILILLMIYRKDIQRLDMFLCQCASRIVIVMQRVTKDLL